MNKKGTSWIMSGLVCMAVSGALLFTALPAAAAGYVQTNLVSDRPGVAQNTDPNLVNPWGMSYAPTGPFWVSDNATGVATAYNGVGQPILSMGSPLVVTIPPPSGSPLGTVSAPTGQVFNGTADFAGSHFIFATEDGTISAWTSGSSAILHVDNSPFGAVYKGLALGNNGSGNFLYAANFGSGAIDVFDANFAHTTLAGLGVLGLRVVGDHLAPGHPVLHS